MAIIKKELPLVFQYIQISSPIPFYIYGSDNEKARRLLPSNAYVLRSAELLTSEKAPNQPIWKVYVEYDDSLLTDGRIVEINGFNVDFSKYLETFGGQLVRFGDDQLQGLYTVINNPTWVSTLAQSLSAVINNPDWVSPLVQSVSPVINNPTWFSKIKTGVSGVPDFNNLPNYFYFSGRLILSGGNYVTYYHNIVSNNHKLGIITLGESSDVYLYGDFTFIKNGNNVRIVARDYLSCTLVRGDAADYPIQTNFIQLTFTKSQYNSVTMDGIIEPVN